MNHPSTADLIPDGSGNIMASNIKCLGHRLTAIVLALAAAIICMSSCKAKIDTEALWKDATYTSDAAVGEGKNTVSVTVAAGERSVILTLKTDKTTLGEALYEQRLINDSTFFDTCNGIKADYAKSGAYWTFYVDGEAAMYGVGDAKASVPATGEYRLEYTVS